MVQIGCKPGVNRAWGKWRPAANAFVPPEAGAKDSRMMGVESPARQVYYAILTKNIADSGVIDFSSLRVFLQSLESARGPESP
jgi:hypothetical protein